MTIVTVTDSGVVFDVDGTKYVCHELMLWRELVNPRTLYWQVEDTLKAVRMWCAAKSEPVNISQKLHAAAAVESRQKHPVSAADVAANLGDVLDCLLNKKEV